MKSESALEWCRRNKCTKECLEWIASLGSKATLDDVWRAQDNIYWAEWQLLQVSLSSPSEILRILPSLVKVVTKMTNHAVEIHCAHCGDAKVEAWASEWLSGSSGTWSKWEAETAENAAKAVWLHTEGIISSSALSAHTLAALRFDMKRLEGAYEEASNWTSFRQNLEANYHGQDHLAAMIYALEGENGGGNQIRWRTNDVLNRLFAALQYAIMVVEDTGGAAHWTISVLREYVPEWPFAESEC